MKYSFIIVLSVLIFLTSLSAFSYAQEITSPQERAREILREVDDIWRGTSSHTVFSMKVQTAHYTRNMKLEGWSKGKEKTLVRILEPLKEKGTSTLKSGNSIYSYLPRTDRTIRLTSGMMMGSWMGSHFTNDDLVRESRMEEDYVPTISFEGVKDGQDIIEFSLIPKPDAPVVWGKVSVTVLADGFVPLIQYYYDEDMNIARTILFDDIVMMAGRMRPKIMRIIPEDKPDEYTEMVYDILELGIDLSDSLFSIVSLRRR